MEPLGTYDDYILVPKKGLNSRFDADPYINFLGFERIAPFIIANMTTTATRDMAFAVYNLGVVVPIHRFQKIESQVEIVEYMYHSKIKNRVPIAATIGLDEPARAKKLAKFVDVFFLEMAYAYTDKAIEEIKRLKNDYGIKLVVGNVCTLEAVEALYEAGADVIKCGIGSGSVCITQRVTGCGFPQLDAIRYCSIDNHSIIADGGVRGTGDLLKAIVSGATATMVGSLFAGTDESSGYGKDRVYSGMASKEVRMERDGRIQGGIISEGISATVPYKGAARTVAADLLAGIRQGMSLLGAERLEDIRGNNKLLHRISEAAKIEGSPHILNSS